MSGDAFKAKFDDSGMQAALDRLKGPLREKLARSIAVAGGKVLRDEAKLLAPVETGNLRNAIYLAHREKLSNETQQVYSVSWNAKLAPHGHLLEFGHWRVNAFYKASDGTWRPTNVRLKAPKWMPAHPFLRPALTNAGEKAKQAMVQRGRERLPELLREEVSNEPRE